MRYPQVVLLIACAVLVAAIPLRPTHAQPAPVSTVYLPLVHKVPPPTSPRSLFGLQIGALANDQALDLGAAAAPGLSRVGDVLWSDIEPTRGGTYQWQLLAPLEQRIAAVRARGIEPLVIVQWSPVWARLYPQSECGPIKPEAYGEFATFLTALSARYSDGPFQVRYWEIWNEPDFSRTEVPAQGGYGCWADAALPYSGGEQFGALMKVAYAGVKAGNLNAVVVSGSITRNFPNAPYESFLEGMLRAGATFDQFGFHAYGYWAKEDLLVRKVAFTRALLAKYGYKDTPLLLTEVAALCLDNDLCRTIPPSSLSNRQARDTARLNAEVLALGPERRDLVHTRRQAARLRAKPADQRGERPEQHQASVLWAAHQRRAAGRRARHRRQARRAAEDRVEHTPGTALHEASKHPVCCVDPKLRRAGGLLADGAEGRERDVLQPARTPRPNRQGLLRHQWRRADPAAGERGYAVHRGAVAEG